MQPSPLGSKEDIVKIAQVVARKVEHLVQQTIGRKLPISYLTIFSHHPHEYNRFVEWTSELGTKSEANNGLRFTLKDPIKTDGGDERLTTADIAIVDCYLTPITRDLLKNLPKLKFLSTNSTGYDGVDVEALRESSIAASNVSGFSTEAVAEMATALMFAVVRKIPEGDREFRQTQLVVDPGTPAAQKYLTFDLKGKTLGIVGLGSIGTRVAEIGNGIGMKIVGFNRTNKPVPNVSLTGLEEVMSTSDVVIICLALNAQTKGTITKQLIASMKKSAILVNIGGMSLIDQDALIAALNSGSIAGAGLDTAGADMLAVKNTVITPHMAYNTRESYENMGTIADGTFEQPHVVVMEIKNVGNFKIKLQYKDPIALMVFAELTEPVEQKIQTQYGSGQNKVTPPNLNFKTGLDS